MNRSEGTIQYFACGTAEPSYVWQETSPICYGTAIVPSTWNRLPVVRMVGVTPEWGCAYCGSPNAYARTHCSQCGAPREAYAGNGVSA